MIPDIFFPQSGGTAAVGSPNRTRSPHATLRRSLSIIGCSVEKKPRSNQSWSATWRVRHGPHLRGPLASSVFTGQRGGGGELGGRRELNTELLSVPRLGKNGEGSGAEGDGGGGSGRDREVLPDLNARTLSLYLSNSLSELSSRLFRPPR